jgi:hypothetical protein
MKALGRPFATTDDLLKMKKLGPKEFFKIFNSRLTYALQVRDT